VKGCRTLLLGLLIVAGFAVSLFVPSGSASAATTTVAVGDMWFCSASFQGGVCETTITVGDTVAWDFSGAGSAHTVTECGASCDTATSTPLFSSGVIQDRSTFQFQFVQPGIYLYFCRVHPFDMRGRIVVQAAAAQTPAGQTPAAGTTPAAGATPTASSGGGTLPATGYGSQGANSSPGWTLAALAVAGLTFVAFGAYVRSRSRER
jgi:plastocyanin